MSTIIIDLQYLPTLEYFCSISKADTVIIEAKENYIKQSFRNRTHILGANGVCSLTVPVINGNSKTPIQELRIDNSQNWINIHWRTLQSAYGKAPFFEYYESYFKELLYAKEEFLFDLNKKLLTICLKLLEFDTKVIFSKEYSKTPNNDVLDLRSAIHPKNSFATNRFYQSQPYIQLFGSEFVSNMSIVDLIFCEGPNSGYIISQSTIN